jgi:hypothetical protein
VPAGSGSSARLPAEYVLPLRWSPGGPTDELTAYLTVLVGWIPVTVVDGSADDVFDAHHRRWAHLVRHVRPDPWPGSNGKVAGVMTGIRLARHDRVVVADDDVRYVRAQLASMVALLGSADLVRPQNYFDPMPWHARWDTARTLVNRAIASDYPGTLGVRRSTVLRAGGYRGDVLFENLELIRTVRAVDGRERRADDLYVARRPPTVRHFCSQRVRQAYDSFAQPARLAVELALLPGVLAVATSRPRVVLVAAAVSMLVAEGGRRRGRGAAVFPSSCALFAPCWVLERAVCTWVGLLLRAGGGVSYAGGRLTTAASSTRSLRRRLRSTRLGSAP